MNLIKNKILQNSNKIKIGLIVFICLFFFMSLPAFAGFEEYMENMVINISREIYMGGFIKTVTKIILANPQEAYSDAWEVMELFYADIVLPVAFALLALHLVIDMINSSIKIEQVSYTTLIKPFLKFMIAFIVMKNGLNILVYLIALGHNFATDIANKAVSADGIANLFGTAQENAIRDKITGPLDGIMEFVQLLFPWILSFILNIATQVICYSWTFELYIKTMLAPIGMCDVVTKGIEGNGLRYFKNYFATVLQGAIMVTVALLYSLIAVNLITETLSILVFGFAALATMFKAGTLAKEIIGT